MWHLIFVDTDLISTHTAAAEWLLLHPVRPMYIYDVATLFGNAYPRASIRNTYVRHSKMSS